MEDKYLPQELAYAMEIKTLLDAGWVCTGLRLVQDPKISAVGKAFTLFPAERAILNQTLITLCEARIREIQERIARPKKEGI